MKLSRIFASILLVCGAVSFVACSDDDEETVEDQTPAPTPTEGITLDPTNPSVISLGFDEGATADFHFSTTSGWSTEIEFTDGDGWFSISPESGSGSTDWLTITVTATDNNRTGSVRKGVVYLIPESGDEVAVQIEQESDAVLTISGVGLSMDAFSVNKESENSIVVSYANAHEGDVLEVAATLSGASAGLSVGSGTFEVKSGEGTVEVPITGTPTAYSGTVNIAGTVEANGEEVDTFNLEATVYIYYFGFEKFVWGGDYVGQQNGLLPNKYDGSEGAADVKPENADQYDWTGASGVTECGPGAAATDKLLKFDGEILELFDLGWWDDDVYGSIKGTNMFYHCARLGCYNTDDDNGGGAWKIPFINNIPEGNNSNSVRLTFDACRWIGDSGGTGTEMQVSYFKSKFGSGEEQIQYFEDELPKINDASELAWTTLSFDFTNVDCFDGTVDEQGNGSKFLRINVPSIGNKIFVTNIRVELLSY